MDKIIEMVQQWPYLETLPDRIGRFVLSREMRVEGTRYCVFSYHYQEKYRSFYVVYDKATKDFMARVTVGLTEYCDVNTIAVNLENLEKLLSGNMEKTLLKLSDFNVTSLCSICREKQIVEWEYGHSLPENVAGFELYIRPAEPVRMLNGSYAVLDYSNFDTESNLIVYYNIFRDEFFGEIRIRRTPESTTRFDAKTLPELEEQLQKHLIPVLENMNSGV
ncbi:MAG TPA: hypothetical protein VN611_13990 [Patescibacteria group bacterium]|nr:hypothetical protein [Patescibacteria group bacterium]